MISSQMIIWMIMVSAKINIIFKIIIIFSIISSMARPIG